MTRFSTVILVALILQIEAPSSAQAACSEVAPSSAGGTLIRWCNRSDRPANCQVYAHLSFDLNGVTANAYRVPLLCAPVPTRAGESKSEAVCNAGRLFQAMGHARFLSDAVVECN
jgi:hypothetical protein